jgi:hypothetical protein
MRLLKGLLFAVAACREPVDVAAITETAPRPTPVAPAVVEPPPLVGDPALHFSDPRLLERWDADASSPLSLASVFRRIDAKDDAATGATTGELLSRHESTWGVIAATLASDIDRIVKELDIDWENDITRTYDIDAAKTELGRGKFYRGNGNVARVFQPQWLRSRDGQFLLSGALYRPDRRDFVPGSCGELRLLYRLAYEVEMEGRVYASRMPFTINVVFTVPDDGARCRNVAARWRSEALTDANADAIATSLLEGPLDLDAVRFQQIELDAQIVRFPSDLENVEGRRFAGQALYWLRIFALHEGRFRPIPLENTPDVLAIRRDPSKRAALVDFVRDNLDAIDRGVFRVPASLLADVALSWSTYGTARLANRPFASILGREEADTIVSDHPGERAFLADGASLLERLDAASCMGCHQSSSTAGFHFLGVDRRFGEDDDAVALATDGNRLQLPFSPHFRAELERRAADLESLVRGDATTMIRPHPSAPPARWSDGRAHYQPAAVGMPCPLGSLADGSTWSCAEGLTCRALAHDPALPFALGQCVPDDAHVSAGLSCRSAEVNASRESADDLLAWNVRAFSDRVVAEEALYRISEGAITTRAYNCRPTRIGVPLGRVTRNCRDAERTLAEVDHEVCAIVGGRGFEEMAKGYFDSRAFAAGVGRGLLDACSPDRFCREDYICQQLPDFLADRGVAEDALARLHAQNVGFCTPTYFVYQLRLDGHPNPR